MFTKEKRLKALFLVLIFVLSIFVGGCREEEKNKEPQTKYDSNIFSVNYIDVGNGDCIFINLGDGKSMMIDCAEKSDKNRQKIFAKLSEYDVENINYLLLTHPDGDHIGNAKDIIEKFKIENAYLPKTKNIPELIEYNEIVSSLEEKGTKIFTSESFLSIRGEEYEILFLSPLPYGMENSSYNDYFLTENPTEEMSNNLSPIIYLEYKGVKFIFTGDAGYSQEKIVLENNLLGFYNKYTNRKDFSLENIDFLKVAHHGANGSTGVDFLNLLKPKNAVISVGGNNFYGHPSSSTILNLIECNENCNIYRTDRDGSITVLIDENGKITTLKESEK